MNLILIKKLNDLKDKNKARNANTRYKTLVLSACRSGRVIQTFCHASSSVQPACGRQAGQESSPQSLTISYRQPLGVKIIDLLTEYDYD